MIKKVHIIRNAGQKIVSYFCFLLFHFAPLLTFSTYFLGGSGNTAIDDLERDSQCLITHNPRFSQLEFAMAAASSSNHLLNKSAISIWWNKLLDITGDDPTTLWVFGSTLVAIVIYWTYAGICSVIDVTNRPRWLLKYKIQPNQNVPIDKAKYWKAVKQVIFNQLIVTPPCIFMLHSIGPTSGAMADVRQLPTLSKFLIDVGLMALIEEPMFYYIHRLLHHRFIYKYIHKKHHEWTSPIAAITFYCHPVEHLVSNIGPIGISAALLNTHITVAWTFIILAIVNAMTDHMGYSFPFPFYKSSVPFHDYHHAKFNYNFGVFGWLDKLHGTFREYPVVAKNKDKNINNNGAFKIK